MESKKSLLPIKHMSNISNAFNNEGIIPAFVFILFSVCSIMAKNGNHTIVYFIYVGQYESLS